MLRDGDHAGILTVEAVHGQRKIERLLNLPDPIVLIRRQNLYRIANRHPADWHRLARREPRPQVDDGVDADLGALADRYSSTGIDRATFQR
jgi:hypothetical protein